MKRTRKWEYVKQEATRLAGLGLGTIEIARRLGLERTTVYRWFKAGKLARQVPVAGRSRAVFGESLGVKGTKSPSEWAASVRAEFSLSDTDDQLVTLAESALLLSRDPTAGQSVRMAAMREFRAAVKDLALISKAADVPATPVQDEQPKPAPRVLRKTGTDPRALLMAVK